MLTLNFQPFPVIETQRLLLREFEPGDAENLFVLRKDIDVLRYLDREPHHTIEDSQAMIEKIRNATAGNEAVGWAITIKPDTSLAGTISYHRIEKENHRAEVGYLLHPSLWRKGIVNEAMISVLHYGFHTLKFHSIEANINPNNAASAGLLRKHGFVSEAYFKENYFFDGKFLDTEIYSLLASNYAG